MFDGYEPAPWSFDRHRLEADFNIEKLELDMNALRELVRRGLDAFLVFDRFEVRKLYGGLPTMTADGPPLLGLAGGIDEFFFLSNCCVGRLSISPALGKLLAQWIVEGNPPANLSQFAADRIPDGYDDPQRFGQA